MKPFKSTTRLRPLTDAELQLEDPQWEDDDMRIGRATFSKPLKRMTRMAFCSP